MTYHSIFPCGNRCLLFACASRKLPTRSTSLNKFTCSVKFGSAFAHAHSAAACIVKTFRFRVRPPFLSLRVVGRSIRVSLFDPVSECFFLTLYRLPGLVRGNRFAIHGLWRKTPDRIG